MANRRVTGVAPPEGELAGGTENFDHRDAKQEYVDTPYPVIASHDAAQEVILATCFDVGSVLFLHSTIYFLKKMIVIAVAIP